MKRVINLGKMTNIKCSTGEVAKDYNSYLKTRHWRQMRIEVAESHEYTCLRCYGVFRQGFHIHHNTYKRVGSERLSDLDFYCKRCHSIIHQDRKNKRAFNKQYNNLISSKMSKMNEEQIERVLKFINKVARESKK